MSIAKTISIVALVGGFVCGHCQCASAQVGLLESLERLDTNENGLIEPNEVTPLARPYLERVALAGRLTLDRANGVAQLQEAARIHYATQNAAARPAVRPRPGESVGNFDIDRSEPLVPEFGSGDLKIPYVQSDLEQADSIMLYLDLDGSGSIDPTEALRAAWPSHDPFVNDLNKDDRLSRLELTQHYARQRLLPSNSDALIRKYRQMRVAQESSPPTSPDASRERSWRREGTSHWLALSVMGRFDRDRNGRLDRSESTQLGMPVGQIDMNRDGEISRDELLDYVVGMQDAAGGLDNGIPGWFFERDANRDNQVSLAEFAPEPTPETIAEFVDWDTNGDGLLTAAEIAGSRAAIGGTFRSDEAKALPPGQTIISEIDVKEDFVIADLNVQLSITHSQAGQLDAYLTGPGGERIELFTEVGGHDDNFNDTIFDDQASEPIVKGRAPFEGSYIPEGLLKQQPGLSEYNNKSIQGVWQLVIRGTRSERFGMLHSWSLQARPIEN